MLVVYFRVVSAITGDGSDRARLTVRPVSVSKREADHHAELLLPSRPSAPLVAARAAACPGLKRDIGAVDLALAALASVVGPAARELGRVGRSAHFGGAPVTGDCGDPHWFVCGGAACGASAGRAAPSLAGARCQLCLNAAGQRLAAELHKVVVVSDALSTENAAVALGRAVAAALRSMESGCSPVALGALAAGVAAAAGAAHPSKSAAAPDVPGLAARCLTAVILADTLRE